MGAGGRLERPAEWRPRRWKQCRRGARARPRTAHQGRGRAASRLGPGERSAPERGRGGPASLARRA